MKELYWEAGMTARRRDKWLLLIDRHKVYRFVGETIPYVCVVKGADYVKCGDWSHYNYRLVTPDNVRSIMGREGWETGTFREGLGEACSAPTPDTWLDCANLIGVPVTEAEALVRAYWPRDAEHFDRVENELDAVSYAEHGEGDPIIVTTTFGYPTRRQMEAGFWTTPKALRLPSGAEATLELIDPVLGWRDDNVRVVGADGRVISVVNRPGHHGGLVSITVAVSEQCALDNG